MVDIEKIIRKLNVTYARYLKFKRADRYSHHTEVSYAEKHSERVNFMKKFIMRMVILLIILLFVWPFASKDWIGSKISFRNEPAPEQTKKDVTKTDLKNKNEPASLPVMLQPKFFGKDDNGQPYNISADSGVSVSEQKIVLSNLSGDMYLKDSSRMNLVSSHGDYLTKEKQLVLNGGVVITTDRGYEFKTNSAYVKLNENMATGSEEVKIKGRIGDIDAKGFIIRNSGEEIALFGGVNLEASIDDNDIDKLDSGTK